MSVTKKYVDLKISARKTQAYRKLILITVNILYSMYITMMKIYVPSMPFNQTLNV